MNILGTEVNEFVTNRQQSKIHYLSQQNKDLQEYICDLENSLRLNKQAMAITCHETLVTHLNQENTKLIEALSKQQKAFTQLQTKVSPDYMHQLLLQEQIAEEQQNYFKDLIADLEYKLIELKRNVHDKEYAIQELERMKPIMEREGQLIKVIEIVTPSEQNMKMHDELENVRAVLNKITTEAQNIQEVNQQLRDANYVCVQSQIENLKREVMKLRIVLRSQVNYQIMKDFVYQEYIEKTDSNIALNNEIQNHRQKLEQIHNETYGMNSLGYGFSPEPQQLKYLSKNERMIYQEKLHKMEMMVKGFKELFEKEKQNFAQSAMQHNELLKRYESLLDSNELLIRAVQMKDEKVEKVQSELLVYRKQNAALMEQIKSRKTYNGNGINLIQEQDIAVGIFSPRFTLEDRQIFSSQRTQTQSDSRGEIPEQNRSGQNLSAYAQNTSSKQIPMKIKKPQLKPLIIEEEPQEEVNNYCQTARADMQAKGFTAKQEQVPSYYQMTKQECIMFLYSMKADFFQHFDVQSVKKQQLMRQISQLPQKIKRSNSDPFMYFSADQKVGFTQPPTQSTLAITKNEIREILSQLEERKYNQQRQNNLFQLDISNIGGIDARKQAPMIDIESSFISNL